MNIRGAAFWTLDCFQGRHIANYLRKVNEDMMSGRIDEGQLESILSYTTKNIPYYSQVSSTCLQDFPIMNKSKYLNDYSSFLSPDYKEDELYSYATSGSSGTPFHGFQDKNKREKHTADLIYFHGKCGWNLGEKYIFLRAWVDSYKNSQFHNFKNNVIPFDVLHLDTDMMHRIVELLEKDKSIKMILGYGSALNQLADYIEENNIYIDHLKVIISDSDRIYREKRAVLENRLNCKVVDRYSNEEHGLIAFSYGISEPYQVNYSSYLVEILKLDSDDYADKGQPGRVVITDLYNRAMPLIRYELGDIAISDDNSRCGVTTIRELEGRLSDMLILKNGIKISSATINNYMENLVGLERYQLIQNTANNFTLYVIDKYHKFSDEEYISCLRSVLGDDSLIEIIRTDSIKVDKNGKYRTFKSLLDLNRDCNK